MLQRRIDSPPLSGESNTSHFIHFEGREALLRVPQRERTEDIVSYYYARTGFTSRDNGHARRRTPQEQYNFSRLAAAAGLAVLPPLDFVGNKIVYPYLGQAETLLDFLQQPDSRDHGMMAHCILTDLHRAHGLGFVYGDRNPTNILTDPHGFIQIDFDWALTGPTRAEFEVAETTTFMMLYGDTLLPAQLATMLGTMAVHDPGWVDLTKTGQYMQGIADIMHDTLGHGERILAAAEALATGMLATRQAIAT